MFRALSSRQYRGVIRPRRLEWESTRGGVSRSHETKTICMEYSSRRVGGHVNAFFNGDYGRPHGGSIV